MVHPSSQAATCLLGEYVDVRLARPRAAHELHSAVEVPHGPMHFAQEETEVPRHLELGWGGGEARNGRVVRTDAWADKPA